MELLEEVKSSLEKVQNFDPSSIVRREDLGSEMNFEPAEAPLRKFVALCRQIPVDQLDNLSQQALLQIRQGPDQVMPLINFMMNFRQGDRDAFQQRNNLISGVMQAFESYFPLVHPLISYMAVSQTSITNLERKSREQFDQLVERAEKGVTALEQQQEEGARVLQEIRKTAGQLGVSEQAKYFDDESRSHMKWAVVWGLSVVVLACLSISYLVISVFITTWFPALKPTNYYETANLALSKTLIFAVIVYLLLLSAKNFISHQHNKVINRHRKNALLTYNALVEAGGTQEKRDIILSHAAACIFGPQETGYTRASPQTNVTGLVESIAKIVPSTAHVGQ